MYFDGMVFAQYVGGNLFMWLCAAIMCSWSLLHVWDLREWTWVPWIQIVAVETEKLGRFVILETDVLLLDSLWNLRQWKKQWPSRFLVRMTRRIDVYVDGKVCRGASLGCVVWVKPELWFYSPDVCFEMNRDVK